MRSPLQSPAFTGVAVLSLALGIGPNTAMFSLIDTLYELRRPPDDPDRIDRTAGIHGSIHQ